MSQKTISQVKKFLNHRAVIGGLAFVLGMTTFWVGQKTLFKPKEVRHPFGSFFDGEDDPFEKMHEIQEQMLRRGLHDNSMGQIGRLHLDSDEIHTREDDKFVYYEIAIEGLSKDKVKINIQNGQMTVSGTTEKKSEDPHSQSYFSSSFQRSFSIPENVSPEKAEIEQSKDKLIVKFPKTKT